MDNQIRVKITSIDSKTRQARVNTFDTIEIRSEEFGYLKKTFHKVGEYITDSTGSTKIKIDSTKINDISVSGLNVLGGDMYYPGHLKNGQEVNIEVKFIEK
ncbi:hypothetical protein [Chryseobacterium potabilaquae]|uniref:Uncharacterized protein n=1 Tax=Chryseobacterium potabilaquae TaxID=2675057 RepID=A0A6N4X8A4_9FLAO|nr:hypothetical protein [Chryseobacterium potabilaquae]CAA7195191.1 hypothetical protein CHRY9293_01422 [Chryseobacterium potabilaquae]